MPGIDFDLHQKTQYVALHVLRIGGGGVKAQHFLGKYFKKSLKLAKIEQKNLGASP